uniref:MARVEL domain-containing protein n=1 Tax=Trichobilharzia regenti TaxID=157069 RepID=A0AA85K3D4_TRIRE|nr:unnamed protein product [Trichobilharzia regenti]
MSNKERLVFGLEVDMFSVDWIYSTTRLEFFDYVRKPQVLLRLSCMVLATVVIGIVHNCCYVYGICLFNEDQGSCGYSLFLSSMSLIVSVIYLWLDIIVDNVTNVDIRKSIVKIDTILTSLWSFLWLVAFCLLCNRWQNTKPDFLTHNAVSADGPRSAIAFTFFTMVVWIILGYFTYKSYKATEALCSNFAYGETDNSPGYHGFSNDANMLDATGPGPLDPDTPTGHANMDYHVGNIRAGFGGVYSGDTMGGYQP